MKKRIETDSMGTVEVPADAAWGAQTERALASEIPVGRLPDPLWRALVTLKKGAAQINEELGLVGSEPARAIWEVADELLDGSMESHFPLSAFQTGSGTSANMNVNEVLANLANERLGGKRGDKAPVHPNDQVNRCQSSNDVFPSAIHLAAALGIGDELLPALDHLAAVLEEKSRQFADVVKLGRTHLMDALPVTLGQEFGGYASQVRLIGDVVKRSLEGLTALPLGGTAVGTGVNAHPEFAERVINWLSAETGLTFRRADSPFEAQSARTACLEASGALRGVAVAFSRIANDLRWLASGPHGGLGELRLPSLQPGSSIMPGKVNPVVPESVLQAAAQVVGNDAAVTQGALGSVLELNLMMPLIARNLLEQIALMTHAARLLADRCVAGIEADPERCRALLDRSLSLVTPLAETIGYDAAARVAHKAYREKITLREAALELEVATPEELDRALDPAAMLGPEMG